MISLRNAIFGKELPMQNVIILSVRLMSQNNSSINLFKKCFAYKISYKHVTCSLKLCTVRSFTLCILFDIIFGLVCLVLWHINLCRLFNAKSIFM